MASGVWSEGQKAASRGPRRRGETSGVPRRASRGAAFFIVGQAQEALAQVLLAQVQVVEVGVVVFDELVTAA